MRHSFNGVQDFPQSGFVGRRVSGDSKALVTGAALRTAFGTPQVITIASGSPANSTAYVLRAQDSTNGIDETITTAATDGSASAAELEALIEAAWNANDRLRGAGVATDASGDVVISMNNYLLDLTVTEVGTSVLTITETTAPSAVSAIPFGRWIQLAAPGSGVMRSPTCSTLADVTRAAVTLAITHGGGGAYTVEIAATSPHPGLPGIFEQVAFSAGGSAAATDDAAEAALLAVFPAASGWVITNPSTGSVVLTAPIGWRLQSADPTASAGALTSTDTAAGSLPSIAFVYDPRNEASNQIGVSVTGIAAGRQIPYVIAAPGTVWGVEASGATPTFGGIVYVEFAAGAQNGRPYTVQSATGSRLPLVGLRWYGVDPVDTNVYHILFA